jgi:CPA2 family monovalent cation:H+ antiporter-2
MHLAIVTAAPPEFFFEVVALLVTTALVAYICHRIGIMPIVAFLVTGALIGPHAAGFVRDEALIEATAEVGVILLLFTIGIEFSLEKLSRIKRIILIGGGLQVGLVITLVAGLLAVTGVDWRTGVFTGCLVALSSTAIVMKLQDNRDTADVTEVLKELQRIVNEPGRAAAPGPRPRGSLIS